jgi:hypothetical protein
MAKLDTAALAKLGFTDDIGARKAQATIIIAGMEGTGKTHWALTAPKPLLYMSTDFGDEGVIQKADGQIFRRSEGDYKLEIPREYRAFIAETEKPDQRKAREGKLANYIHEQFYIPFFDDLKAAVAAGVRTVVWDNALDVWDYTRLSVYGRNATNRSDLQAEANMKYVELVRHCNIHNVNLIMINHLKFRWESYYDTQENLKWRKTTDHEMQGFDKAPFLVTANLWTQFTEPDTFEVRVKKCRDRPEYVGQTFPAMPFEELMAILIPTVSDWNA